VSRGSPPWRPSLVCVLVLVACHHGSPQPAVPPCAAAADHVGALLGKTPRAIRTREVFAQRCTVDEWGADVRACIVATRTLREPHHCKSKLTTGQRAALERDLAVIDASIPRSPMRPCHAYRALIDRLDSCHAISPDVRAMHESEYRSIADNLWGNRRDRKDPPAGADVICQSRLEILRRFVVPRCGW
jgi:hypothetical protein